MPGTWRMSAIIGGWGDLPARRPGDRANPGPLPMGLIKYLDCSLNGSFLRAAHYFDRPCLHFSEVLY